MDLGAHLHQTLRARRALGKRVKTRLDGHDRQNQRGVNPVSRSNLKRLHHQSADGLGCNAVFATQPHGDIGLVGGQVARVGGGRAVYSFRIGVKTQVYVVACLQPVNQLTFCSRAKIGLCAHQNHGAKHTQSE